MPDRLRRILPGMSRYARARWLVTGGLAVVDAVWAIATGRRFIIPWAILAFVAVMIAETAVCYRRWKARDAEHIRHRFAHCCHTTAQLTAFLCAGLVLSDLAATVNAPFIDDRLAAADAALGFDWLGWWRFVAAHPWFDLLIGHAYMLMSVQVLAGLLYLAAMHGPDRPGASEFVWSQMLAVIIIVPMSAVLPAAGAAYYYGVGMPNYLPDLLALRDGSLIDIDIAANKGLIQFPSYHTAAAMLAINAFRTSRLLFLPNLVLSGLLILAVPVFGNHYAVDAVAGAAVAAIAIWAARRLARRLSAEPAPASAHAVPERSTPSPARAA